MLSSPLSRSQECKLVKVGDPFPPFKLTSNLTFEEQESLNLPAEKTISLKQFTSEILIIELLNVYCHTCQQQVPIFNQLWESVQADTVLEDKVAILGITVGNNAREVVKFQKSFKPQYPVLADQDKKIFNCLGNLKGTPQTYILKKDPSGKWYIQYHHLGAVSSPETYLRKIKELLKGSLEGVEPGYKLPRSFTQTLKKNYPDQSFDQTEMIIYFPSANISPLEGDVRNTTTQMKVLLSLIGEESLEIVIIGFLDQLFVPEELELLQKKSHIFLVHDTVGQFKSLFGVAENPLICLVNDSGRITFRADALTRPRAEELLKGKVSQLRPNLTEKELLERILQAMKEVNSNIRRVEKKELENGEVIYLGFVNAPGEEAPLLARVVSKYSICDVCHDIHYFFIFDQSGHLVSFKPIHITKYGNVLLDQKDIAKIQSRVTGKDLFHDIPFDPFVDAVSQATMSSYLIFEGLNDTKVILGDFKDNGFRKNHWKEICLSHLCQIKDVLRLLREKGITDKLTMEDQTSINMEKIKPYLPSPESSGCPNKGKYLLIGEIPICSIHGMNLKPCPEGSKPTN
jgi:peroxiredoxin